MTEAPGFTVTQFRRVTAENGDARYDDQAESLGERKRHGDVQPALETIQVSTLANREFPPRPWLVQDLIPDQTVTLFIGDGGTGKSLLAQQLAVAVAADRDWIGTLPGSGRVIYVSAEDDTDEVHRRLVDITAAANLALEDLQDLHLVPLAGKDAVFALPNPRSEILATTPLWDAFVARLKQIGPRLVILDNLADIFAGNENSRPQARQFVGILRGLAIEQRLAVVLLGHPSITGMATGTGTSGSTAWSNSARSRLYLERAKIDDGDEPDPNLRILKLMKTNHAAPGAEIRIRWEKGRFKLDGSGPGAFDRLAADSRAENAFLEILKAFRDQGRDVSPNLSGNYAPIVFADLPEGKPIGKRGFTSAMNRLFQSGKIRIEKHGPPSKQRSRIVVTE